MINKVETFDRHESKDEFISRDVLTAMEGSKFFNLNNCRYVSAHRQERCQLVWSLMALLKRIYHNESGKSSNVMKINCRS